MPDYSSDLNSRSEEGHRKHSHTKDRRHEIDQSARRRSAERRKHDGRDGRGGRDELERDQRRRYRSQSPREDLPRVKREHSSGKSPERRHRSSREHHRHSHHRRSDSTSSLSKRRRHDDEYQDRKRSHHHHSRKQVSSPNGPRSLAVATPTSLRSHAPLPSQQAAYSKDHNSDAIDKPPPDTEKQKPNYAPTGALAAETNTVANTSIVLKYHEPPEARKPPTSSPWRLYIFKSSDLLETLPLHERSIWLFGRERSVVDFPTEHPSCSKQHAVLQFRYTEKKDEWGGRKGAVKPYVIDLDSANGTRVNGERIPERRFVEVRDRDVVTFGESTREYVVMLPPKD